MTKNEIPQTLKIQRADGVDFVEASGDIEISELSDLHWGIEGIEGDHATLSVSFDAHSVQDFDAILAHLTAMRNLMAQAQRVAG